VNTSSQPQPSGGEPIRAEAARAALAELPAPEDNDDPHLWIGRLRSSLEGHLGCFPAAPSGSHGFTRPGQVSPDRPAPDRCVVCAEPEAAHRSPAGALS
jgi:hypothetical protein